MENTEMKFQINSQTNGAPFAQCPHLAIQPQGPAVSNRCHPTALEKRLFSWVTIPPHFNGMSANTTETVAPP
jgi:hypothetical protein